MFNLFQQILKRSFFCFVSADYQWSLNSQEWTAQELYSGAAAQPRQCWNECENTVLASAASHNWGRCVVCCASNWCHDWPMTTSHDCSLLLYSRFSVSPNFKCLQAEWDEARFIGLASFVPCLKTLAVHGRSIASSPEILNSDSRWLACNGCITWTTSGVRSTPLPKDDSRLAEIEASLKEVWAVWSRLQRHWFMKILWVGRLALALKRLTKNVSVARTLHSSLSVSLMQVYASIRFVQE